MGTEFDTLPAGSAPLIARYCREINIAGIINDMVQWDPQQWTITPGDLAVTLIVNLLVDRHPLYRVMEFYENRDLDLLFGKDKVYLSGLNDIHYGRMLDRLFDANPKHVFQTITASAIMTHKIKLDRVHADTTSQSVYGEYEDESDAINITFGFSKAKRPDLKQFIYGLMVAEGVPVIGNLRDGNTSDKEWNYDTIKEMSAVLAPHIAKGLLYVADSAVVTSKNLALLKENKIKFVTRLPSTYKLVAKLKQDALASTDWIEIGKISERQQKDDAIYRTKVLTTELDGNSYRFAVTHSTSLAKTKVKTINRKIAKEAVDLAKECVALSKRSFACEPDAQTALDLFMKEHASFYHYLNGTVASVEIPKPRKGRGRPPRSYVPETEVVWKITASVGDVKSDQVDEDLHQDELFILMTNELDDNKLPDADILKVYKDQMTVENRFRWLKNPLVIKGIYIKNPERVLSLGYLFLIGLQIYSLLERRIRQNLAKQSAQIRLQGNRITKKPTATAFLQLFTDIVVVNTVIDGQVGERMLPKRFNTPELARNLALAGFTTEIYTTPP
jgi:transposase